MRNITVIVDAREYRTAEEVVKNLRRLGATVVERQLEVGDYVVSERVAIERKKAHDFISSIVDGRLFEQAKKLVEHYERPVIIIEGNLWSAIKYRNVHEHAVLGALIAVTMKFNIRVLFSKDPETTAFIIFDIAKNEQEKEKKSIKTVTIRKTATVKELQIQFLASLPGIGPKRAEALLKEFGSPLEALNNLKLWSRVGIPESTIAIIRKVLTAKYGETEQEQQVDISEILSKSDTDSKASKEKTYDKIGIFKYLNES